MKTNSQITISGGKITLVPYRKTHVEKYHNWMQNPELLELTASEQLTLSQEYEMQQSWFEDEDKCTFIIVDNVLLKDSGNEVESMIGDVNLYLNDIEDNKCAEVEVMIADPVHRSKGKGREALLFMLRFGTEVLSLRKFVAKIKIINEKSLHLFSSLGFIENSRSDVFQEVALICQVTEAWKEKLIQDTQYYKIHNF